MIQFRELSELWEKGIDLRKEMRAKSIAYIRQELGENGSALFNRDDCFCVTYDGGNHPEYASNAFSDVYGVFTKNNKVYLNIEDCEEYYSDRVMSEDLYCCCENLDNAIKTGDKVKWYDPAVDDYPESERQEALNRVFEVVKIDGITITISDGYSEAEVDFDELDKI